MSNLSTKLSQVDEEFKDFLSDLTHDNEHGSDKLTTFSPLDAVADFDKRGLQAIAEVSKDEMLADDNGMRKLLTNMLAQCRPGSLSDEDIAQLSGINGREVNAGL